MILLQLAAAYLTLFAAGMGVTLLLLRSLSRLNLLECGCLAWLFGVGVVSLLLWIGGTLVSGVILQAIVTVACLALGVTGWRAKQRAGVIFELPRPSGITQWLLTIFVLLEIATIFFVSAKHTLGWDGLLNWEIKARYAFVNGGVLPVEYYSSAGRSFSHPEYPLGIPLTELWLYMWIGEAHQFWIKTIFPFFYAAGACLLALIATRISGRCWVGLLIAALFPFIPYFTSGPGGVIVGYVDFPVSIVYLTGLGYLLYSLSTRIEYPFYIYASCLALLPWLKQEGAILWCVLVALGLVVSWQQKKVRLFAVSILPGLFVIISWRLYLKLMDAVPPTDFSPLSVHALLNSAHRVGPICRTLFAEIESTNHWGSFWLLTGLALLYLLVLFRDIRSVVLAGAILVPVMVYSSTYLFSAWPSYTAHVTASMPRLLLHIVPTAWLAIGLALSFRRVEPEKQHT